MAAAEGATYRARQLVVYFGRPQSAAVLDLSSSADGHFVRVRGGDEVMRLWGGANGGRLADEDGRAASTAAPAVLLRPERVLAKFDVELGRGEQVFGEEVVPLALRRRSDGALVARLWVHPEAGVVYRRELYGEGGRLLCMATMLEMRWERSVPEPVEPSHVAPLRTEDASEPDAPRMLPGGYRLVGTYRVQTRADETDHWVYSDGLHALSVFRTQGALRPPRGFVPFAMGGERAWRGPGPGTWAWEGGGASYFVIAEEPALDPVHLTEPLPRGGRSVWARLGSLWARAARAVVG
jgi:hypothetical protein